MEPTAMNWKRWLFRILAILILLPLILFSIWSWVTLTYVYARGDRAGFVQKISRKGWVLKTWEGELAMVNLPGAMPEIFHFTVRDPTVAREVERMIGKRSTLTYEQHRGLPSNLFGDTSYFIVHVSSS